MRTEQTKKNMQAKRSVKMTVEELVVIMNLIDRGRIFLDGHHFYDRHSTENPHYVTMDTGHSKTAFQLDRNQLFEVIRKFERQYMDAVLDNVEGVVF